MTQHTMKVQTQTNALCLHVTQRKIFIRQPKNIFVTKRLRRRDNCYKLSPCENHLKHGGRDDRRDHSFSISASRFIQVNMLRQMAAHHVISDQLYQWPQKASAHWYGKTCCLKSLPSRGIGILMQHIMLTTEQTYCLGMHETL